MKLTFKLCVINFCYAMVPGADLGFINGGGGGGGGGGLTQGTNLLGRGVQTLPSMRSMLGTRGSGGMPPQENLKNRC